MVTLLRFNGYTKGQSLALPFRYLDDQTDQRPTRILFVTSWSMVM